MTLVLTDVDPHAKLLDRYELTEKIGAANIHPLRDAIAGIATG